MVLVSGLLATFCVFSVDWPSVLLAYGVFTQYRFLALVYLPVVKLWPNLIKKAGRNLLFVSHYCLIGKTLKKENSCNPNEDASFDST